MTDFDISDGDVDSSDSTPSETDFDISLDTATLDSHDSEAIYADEERATDLGASIHTERGDAADNIDPRKLFEDPTLSDIRYYYRRTFADAIVDKPIEDAFKHGFEFSGPNAERAQSLVGMPEFADGHDFVMAHQIAELKSRRDGYCIVFMALDDDTKGLHISPIGGDVNVERIVSLKILTIDDLGGSPNEDDVEAGTGLTREQYHVQNDTGIVLNDDPAHPRFGQPIGYVLGDSFIHRDRTLHYVWNRENDGDFEGTRLLRGDDQRHEGMWEGDPVLLRSYNLFRGLSKGNWSIMQALFRNAAHLYTVELPEDADQEDKNEADSAFTNINAKSEIVHPFGYDVTQHESGGEMEPSQHYDVIFDQLLAGHEMTRSVLFGTQAGTVSGSETDIKNYFNKVERYRQRRGEHKLQRYVTKAARIMDGRASRDFELDVDVEWGPLFKLDKQTRLQAFQTHAQGLTTAIGQYVLTPDEARAILSQEWSNVELDDLTDNQYDVLDRINFAEAGRGLEAEKAEQEQEGNEQNPRTGGQSGGRPAGSSGESADPSADSADAAQDTTESVNE